MKLKLSLVLFCLLGIGVFSHAQDSKKAASKPEVLNGPDAIPVTVKSHKKAKKLVPPPPPPLPVNKAGKPVPPPPPPKAEVTKFTAPKIVKTPPQTPPPPPPAKPSKAKAEDLPVKPDVPPKEQRA